MKEKGDVNSRETAIRRLFRNVFQPSIIVPMEIQPPPWCKSCIELQTHYTLNAMHEYFQSIFSSLFHLPFFLSISRGHFFKNGITINGIFFETKIVLHFILRCVQREMNGWRGWGEKIYGRNNGMFDSGTHSLTILRITNDRKLVVIGIIGKSR